MNGVGAIDGVLYVSGGDGSPESIRALRRVFAYDPKRNRWSQRASLPISSWGGITGVISGKLYVLTGGCAECITEPYTRRLYRYDPTTNRWTRLADCPNQHVLGTGGVMKGKFYVAGGQEAHPEMPIIYSNKLDVYDPTTGSWASGAAMPTARYHAAGAVTDNQLYVVGGTDDNTLFDLLEVYDPSTNTWSAKTPMPTPRMGLAAATVRDRAGVARILAVGGGDNTVGVLATNESYTP
jgi:N-acetylneuraminic acid mutarotase